MSYHPPSISCFNAPQINEGSSDGEKETKEAEKQAKRDTRSQN